MTTKAKHRSILLISLLIYGVVIGDSYLSPLKSSTEIIQDKGVNRGLRYTNYWLATDKRTYSVPLYFYEEVSISTEDTLTVMRSVSNAVKKLYLHDNGYLYPLDYSIMQTASGIGPMLLFLALMLAAFFLYDYLPSEDGKTSVTIASLIFSIGMLVLYIYVA